MVSNAVNLADLDYCPIGSAAGDRELGPLDGNGHLGHPIRTRHWQTRRYIVIGVMGCRVDSVSSCENYQPI